MEYLSLDPPDNSVFIFITDRYRSFRNLQFHSASNNYSGHLIKLSGDDILARELNWIITTRKEFLLFNSLDIHTRFWNVDTKIGFSDVRASCFYRALRTYLKVLSKRRTVLNNGISGSLFLNLTPNLKKDCHPPRHNLINWQHVPTSALRVPRNQTGSFQYRGKIDSESHAEF